MNVELEEKISKIDRTFKNLQTIEIDQWFKIHATKSLETRIIRETICANCGFVIINKKLEKCPECGSIALIVDYGIE